MSGEAARILNKDIRTVSRLFNEGKLPGTATKRGTIFIRKDVERYAENARNLIEVGKKAVEAYVFDAFGVFNVEDFPECVPEVLQSAVEAYRGKRAGRIRFSYEPVGSVFMVGEVATRLAIVDPHTIYRLIHQNKLKCADVDGSSNGENGRLLVTKDSFSEYLDADIGDRFFNSRYAAIEIGRSIWSVDTMALEHMIGRKINDSEKNSNYMFTKCDIGSLNNLKKLY